MLRRTGRDPGIVDDLAADVVSEYLSLPEAERPATETDYEIWGYVTARERVSAYATKEEPLEVGFNDARDTVTKEVSRLDFARSGSSYHAVKATQLLHMEVQDVLRFVGKLPAIERDAVIAIIDHGDVAKYAKDKRVSLFDAMHSLRRARAIMQRYREDDEDEGRERAAGQCTT